MGSVPHKNKSFFTFDGIIAIKKYVVVASKKWWCANRINNNILQLIKIDIGSKIKHFGKKYFKNILEKIQKIHTHQKFDMRVSVTVSIPKERISPLLLIVKYYGWAIVDYEVNLLLTKWPIWGIAVVICPKESVCFGLTLQKLVAFLWNFWFLSRNTENLHCIFKWQQCKCNVVIQPVYITNDIWNISDAIHDLHSLFV